MKNLVYLFLVILLCSCSSVKNNTPQNIEQHSPFYIPSEKIENILRQENNTGKYRYIEGGWNGIYADCKLNVLLKYIDDEKCFHVNLSVSKEEKTYQILLSANISELNGKTFLILKLLPKQTDDKINNEINEKSSFHGTQIPKNQNILMDFEEDSIVLYTIKFRNEFFKQHKKENKLDDKYILEKQFAADEYSKNFLLKLSPEHPRKVREINNVKITAPQNAENNNVNQLGEAIAKQILNSVNEVELQLKNNNNLRDFELFCRTYRHAEKKWPDSIKTLNEWLTSHKFQQINQEDFKEVNFYVINEHTLKIEYIFKKNNLKFSNSIFY